MKTELAEKIIRQDGGISRTASLNDAGIENYEISRMCSAGYIRRVRHGYYSLSDVTEEAIISAVYPEGIVCMQSALFHYGYITSPGIWCVAFPRNISRSKLSMDCIDVKPYFVRDDYIDVGRTREFFNGTWLDVYDRERSVCDLFRYRNRIDDDLFSTALIAYCRDKGKRTDRLIEYSKIMHISRRVRDVMSVLLPGLSFDDVEL